MGCVCMYRCGLCIGGMRRGVDGRVEVVTIRFCMGRVFKLQLTIHV